MEKVVFVDGNTLAIADVIKVAREGWQVRFHEDAVQRMEASRKLITSFVENKTITYGVNTGFGLFSNVAISDDQLLELQRNLIYADVVGIGAAFPTEVVRAMMLLRLNALAKGCSGITQKTAGVLVSMLNAGVHPIIPEKGSVGASGDLCPLAHMALVMIGEGEAEYSGEIIEGGSALQQAGIEPAVLQAKEGLALINGTCAMMGVAVLAVHDSLNLIKSADIAASLTLEGLEGIIDAFDERLHLVRPHKGQIDVAQNIRLICDGSEYVTRQGEKRVQDAYTLRCIPQIHGASRMAFDYVKQVIETEINSATDNPLIFADEQQSVLSGGNFHGQPIAIAMDTLGIAISELANVSERRIERTINPALSNGLPAFLVKDGGLNCGFMVAHYAAAAVVSENKVLAHPASVDSIPTSANQEDHVSMGTTAARKARAILEHAEYVIGLEMMCACQSIDFRSKRRMGAGTAVAYEVVRKEISFMEKDRVLSGDMKKAANLVHSGKIVKATEVVIGELN